MARKFSKTTSTESSKGKADLREYTKEEIASAVDKLVIARIGLLMRHPFFGNMATRLAIVDASTWCSTLATDGRTFYYNVGFVNKLSAKQCEFGFAHEVLHNVFDHMGRRESRDPKLSNIAADYAVNQILKDDKIGEKPDFINIFQDDKYRGWSYEQIYDEIEKKAVKIDLDTLGELLDDHLDDIDDDSNGSSPRPKLTPEEKKQIRDEIREAMVNAASAAGAGNLPAGVGRLIGTLLEPKMNWRELLRMNIQSIIKSNFSFARANRKSQMSGAVLPGMINQETIDICCAVDMSGSITQEQANAFLSEIKGIMDEYVDFSIKLWCFDTNVYNYAEFTGDTASDILSYQVKGGGGTDFMANYEYMKENDINPKRFVMFTDGYPCGSWGDENYCETLFIIHGTDSITPPFGQFAYYD